MVRSLEKAWSKVAAKKVNRQLWLKSMRLDEPLTPLNRSNFSAFVETSCLINRNPKQRCYRLRKLFGLLFVLFFDMTPVYKWIKQELLSSLFNSLWLIVDFRPFQRSSTIIGLKNRKDGDDREVTGSTSELHRRKSLQGMLVDEFPTHLAHQVDEDVQRNHEVLQLQRLFRPLFYFMGAFGLYHPSKRTTSVGTPPELRQRLSTRWLMIIAALCNMGYLVANFVVLIVANPVIDMTSLTVTMYIILLVWMTFAFLLAVLHFVICERTDRFDRIWELWARWARIPRTRNWVKMRRIRTIALVGAGKTSKQGDTFNRRGQQWTMLPSLWHLLQTFVVCSQ